MNIYGLINHFSLCFIVDFLCVYSNDASRLAKESVCNQLSDAISLKVMIRSKVVADPEFEDAHWVGSAKREIS